LFTEDLSGQTIGNYRVIKPIGSGGMAKIYLVQDPQKQVFAMKVLLPHLQNQAEFTERFLREAQNAKVLQHAHIVPIRDYKRLKDGTTFFVMDWIDGGSLAEYAKPNKLTLSQIAQVMTQVAAALDYAHKQGVVHRDIKPSNILLSKSGQAMLADFGVAKVAQATTLTRPGEQPGTPAYMSPEQAQGLDVGPASDIYALGIVLYEMLAGRPPFQGDTSQILAVLYQHVHQPPPPLRQFNPKIPANIEKVVEKALAKKVTDRYSTAGALAQAFWQAVNTSTPRRPAVLWYGVAASALFIGCLFFLGVGILMRESSTGLATITPVLAEVIPAEVKSLETAIVKITPKSSTVTPTAAPSTDEAETPLPNVVPQADEPPVLLEPQAQQSFAAGETITFKWRWAEALAADERFLVTVKDNQRHTWEWPAMTPALVLSEAIVAGNYTWLVSVEVRNRLGKYDRLTLSAPQQFEILAPPETATPIISPTPNAKVTPVALLPAPLLLQPPDQFAAAASKEITLQWKNSVKLTDDQCYAIFIKHRQGFEIIWLSDSSYVLGQAKVWLANRKYGPDLSWQVGIAAKEGSHCEGNTTAPKVELSRRSDSRTFLWTDD